MKGVPAMMTAEEFNAMLEATAPGDYIEYAVAPYLLPDHAEEAAWQSYVSGQVLLVQKRVTRPTDAQSGQFSYRAVVRRNVKPPRLRGAWCEVLSAKQSEMTEIRE
jgi:hypothetical protein